MAIAQIDATRIICVATVSTPQGNLELSIMTARGYGYGGIDAVQFIVRPDQMIQFIAQLDEWIPTARNDALRCLKLISKESPVKEGE